MTKLTASESQSDQSTNSPNVLNGQTPDSIKNKPSLAIESFLLIFFFGGIIWSVCTGKVFPAIFSSVVFVFMVALASKNQHSRPTEPLYKAPPLPKGKDPIEHHNEHYGIFQQSDAWKAWLAQVSFSSFEYWCRFATGIQGINRSSLKDAIDNIKNIATLFAIVAALNLLFNSKSPQIKAFYNFDPIWYFYAKLGFSIFIVPLMIVLAFQTFAVGYLWPKDERVTGKLNIMVNWFAFLAFTFAAIFIGISVMVFWLRMVIYY